MPLRDPHPDLKTYLEKETPKGGFWTNRPKFMVSLLKAFYGDAATKDNEFGYQWLPKRASADAYSHQHMFVDMYEGKIKGFLADGQNPAVGGPNAKLDPRGDGQARLAPGGGHLPHRDGRVLEGAGRRRQGRQDRGVLPAGRAGRGEGRQPHQHHAA